MNNKYLDAALGHYKSLGIGKIEVPEWIVDGVPLVIYWKPMTMAESIKLQTMGASTLAQFVDIIIAKAMNEAGEKMFTIEDKQPLLRAVDRHVLIRVAAAMLEELSVLDAEKN